MKIVVFGGSFNPPTTAHLKLAREVLRRVPDVEKVIFSPVNDMYRKKDLSPGVHRFNMLGLLIQGEGKLYISDMEIKSTEYVYTYDLLKYIRGLYPGREIFFVLGSDRLGQLRKWKDIRKLLLEFKILVYSRNNSEKMNLLNEHGTFKEYRDRFEILDKIEEIDVSSTMIRENLKAGRDISSLTVPEIVSYIKNNGLYLKEGNYVQKLGNRTGK